MTTLDLPAFFAENKHRMREALAMLGHASSPHSSESSRSTSRNARTTDAKFEIYADVSGRYRWRLVSSNGRTTATSGQGYSSVEAAEKAVGALRAESAVAPVELESIEA